MQERRTIASSLLPFPLPSSSNLPTIISPCPPPPPPAPETGGRDLILNCVAQLIYDDRVVPQGSFVVLTGGRGVGSGVLSKEVREEVM